MLGLKFSIRLKGDLGTPLRGDTLFGQLCWALALRSGQDILKSALTGYTQGNPYLVVSDGCPTGYLPKPDLPAPLLETEKLDDIADWRSRKAWSKRKWLPESSFGEPLIRAYQSAELAEPQPLVETLQVHNTIDRQTGTTGTGPFAPYQTWRLSHSGGGSNSFSIYCLVDEERLHRKLLETLVWDIGLSGYGRDASLGLGQFELLTVDLWQTSLAKSGQSVVTLSPSAPNRNSLDLSRSFWRPFTRFGRHGGPAFWGNVFKMPVLMADSGAVLTLSDDEFAGPFVGQGVGTQGRLSSQIPETVHQAYAPFVPVNLDGWHG